MPLIGKVDLVMWTKNGSENLSTVFEKIDRVIPNQFVNRRIVIDDCSNDNTREIAKTHGWSITLNEGTGISDGANTALKKVEEKYFVSFEQDLLLSSDWWRKIPPLMLRKGVAAASGTRYLPRTNPISSIERYTAESKRETDKFTVGKTLDNTIWRTDLLRKVGGFPKLKFAGQDTVLAHLFEDRGYKWLIDASVQSQHLRSGFHSGLKQQYTYARSYREIVATLKYMKISNIGHEFSPNLRILVERLIKSPVVAFYLALDRKDVRLVVAYPIFRLYFTCGYIRGYNI